MLDSLDYSLQGKIVLTNKNKARILLGLTTIHGSFRESKVPVSPIQKFDKKELEHYRQTRMQKC